MIGRNRQRDEALRLRIDAQLGVGEQRLEGGQYRIRVRLGQTVDFQMRKVLRRPGAHALHRFANDFLVVGRAERDKLLAFDVDRQLGLGHQRLNRRDERTGGGRVPHSEDWIGLEPRLVFGRGLRVDSLQRRLDFLVVGRHRVGNDPLSRRVERKLHVGEETLDERQRRLRVGVLQLIDFQARGRVTGFPLPKALHRRTDDFQFRGRSPGDQALGLRIGRELGVGHQRLQRSDDRRHVGRVDGEGLEPWLLVRRAGPFDLFQRRLDRVVYAGAGPDEQPVGLQIEHEFRIAVKLLEHLEHAVRIDRLDRIADQLALLFLRHLGLELLHDL